MLEGRMRHEDHLGNVGLLESGGVQWMTAARGIIHSEMPEQQEGVMRGFQLWLNLPGKDKLDLVENTTADEAGTIDRFAAALRDGGFTPLTFAASEIRWSDHQPGDALATINVTTSNPANPGGFTFPMEFRPHNGGWQLSRETADMLLAFGNARTEAGPTTSPAPPR